MAQRGERLFNDLACHTCHVSEGRGRGPSLKAVFRSQVPLADGRRVTPELYRQIRDEELAKLGSGGRLKDAAAILDELVLSRDFLPFLTLIAYSRLE